MMYIWQKKLKTLFLLIPTVLLLASCVKNTSEDRSFCLIYAPVYYSFDDTELTKREIDTNNLAWECLCNNQPDLCKGAGI